MGILSMSLSKLMNELQAAKAILKPQESIHLAKGQAGPSKFKPKGMN